MRGTRPLPWIQHTGEPLIFGGVTEQVGSNLPFFSCLSIYFRGGFLGYSRIGTL